MDYGAILQRSWELTKKHRWLWVYGLVLAVLGGGGGGANSISNFASRNAKDGTAEQLTELFSGGTPQVLGQATDIFRDWLQSVPLAVWLLLAASSLVFLLVFLITRFVLGSWAKGGLINGLAEADAGQSPTLASTSPSGISAVKPLIVFGILNFFVTLGIMIGLLLLVGLGVLLLSLVPNPARTILAVVGVLAFILTAVALIILLVMVSIYADRLIVLRAFTPWEAWKRGLTLSRGNFLPTLVMGIINYTVSCTIGCVSLLGLGVVLGLPAVIVVTPLLRDGFQLPAPPVAVALLILFLLFVYLSYLVRVILAVFTYGNWNLFFKEVMARER